MTINKALKVLKAYNLWRRDNDGKYEMPHPAELGKAVDVAIKELTKIVKNEMDKV